MNPFAAPNVCTVDGFVPTPPMTTSRCPLRPLSLIRALVLGVPVLAGGCSHDDFDPMGHGTVKVELRRAENASGDPFAGVVGLIIQLSRGECLTRFYESHPEWESTGLEGKPVFDRWRERLCEIGTAECAVEKFSTAPESMAVSYEDLGALEGQVLHYGPVPLAELAGCDSGEDPTLGTFMQSLLLVHKEGENPYWEVVNISPDRVVADQDQPVLVEVTGVGD